MAHSLIKVILDTSVYIPFINDGISHPIFEFEEAIPLFYMSTVVIEELYAGAHERKTIKLLDKLYDTFHDTGRLVAPEASDWKQAGIIIAKLQKKYGFEKKFLAGITNDVLIALSAKRIGAILVTNNTKDFSMIKEFVNFKIYTL